MGPVQGEQRLLPIYPCTAVRHALTVAHGREQAWAQLEEKEGALQRADELRNFRMQERTELVLPAGFAARFDPAQQREAPFQSIVATVRRVPALVHAGSACPPAFASMHATAEFLSALPESR